MADQGKILITMPIPASTARGKAILGDGTIGAGLSVGLVYEGTSSTETRGQVQIAGVGLAIAAGTISAGDGLQADANGEMVAAVEGTNEVDFIALEAAAANELFRVKIK